MLGCCLGDRQQRPDDRRTHVASGVSVRLCSLNGCVASPKTGDAGEAPCGGAPCDCARYASRINAAGDGPSPAIMFGGACGCAPCDRPPLNAPADIMRELGGSGG